MDAHFHNHVFEIIRLISSGRVTTYGSIAKAMGFPNHCRMVGNCLKNYDASLPAHRVCSAGGKISAVDCLDLFTKKLNLEGIEVHNSKIVNFKSVFWDPQEEL